VHRSGSYGYVTALNSGRIYGASADASGTLTEIPGMNALVGHVPGFGDFDATGSYLFVPYGDSTLDGGRVAVFQFNAGSGVLTPVGNYQTGGVTPRYSAMTPNNKFLLVANSLSGAGLPASSLAVFGFSAASGTLSAAPGSPFVTGGNTSFVVVHPTKNFVYVNNGVTGGGVIGFQLDASSGALTPMAGSPFATPGATPVFIRIDPTGKFLYAGNSVGTAIHGFAINQSTGALTPVPGSPFTAGTTPHVINMDPSGRFLYTTNSGSNSLSSFVINPTTGALTLASTVPTGNAPVSGELVGRQ
jgi:YVTN family beta-propeller protein